MARRARQGRGVSGVVGAGRSMPESGINFITCLFMGSCPNWVNIDNAQTQSAEEGGRKEGAAAEEKEEAGAAAADAGVRG